MPEIGTDLVVPTSREVVVALDSPTLYLLEQAGEIAREILDGRIVAWTEEGWSQRKIAKEVGCSHQAISKRQERLGIEPAQPKSGNPVATWSIEEEALRADLENGCTVVINLGVHLELVAWAEAEDLLVRIDRTTIWGNPFKLDKDGDRATVIAAYRDHYLPHKPSLQERLIDLEGKALACWCAPKPCHGDVLADIVGDGG